MIITTKRGGEMKTINVTVTEDCGALVDVEVLYEVVDDSFDYEFGSIAETQIGFDFDFEIHEMSPVVEKKYISQVVDAVKKDIEESIL
jgi:hypothetical protein